MEVLAVIAGILIQIAVLAGVVWAGVAIVRSARGGSDADPFRGPHWYMRPAVSWTDALLQALATLGVALAAVALDLLARQAGWSFFSGRTAVFAAAVAALALAYRLRAPLVLAFGLLAAYLWTGLWLARWAPTAATQPIVVISGLGLLAVTSWALGRIHGLSDRTRRFGFIYWLFGLLGLLAILFWVSSQWGMSAIGGVPPAGTLAGGWRMGLGLGTLLLATLGTLGWWVVKDRDAWPEVLGMAVLAIAFAAFAVIPPSTASPAYDGPFSGETLKLTAGGMAWAVTFNALLLGALLGLVALGYARREDWLVNLGAVLLFLFVLVKYFDWLFTFLDRSLAFIVTGLLLVGVGLAMERGRRLVLKAMEADDAAA